MRRLQRGCAWLLFFCTGAAASGADKVDFRKDVQPILQSRCMSCHGRGKLKGGLSLETRDAILKGGEDGPAAVSGKSGESLLIQLIEGHEPDRKMPAKGEALTAQEVATLKTWIDQGMTWPEGFTFGFRRAPIAPRRPEIPRAGAELELRNPIDLFLAAEGVKFDAPAVSDRMFYRRASLDLVGLLPTEDEIQKFEGDKRTSKRSELVSRLLNNKTEYALHWMSFWNDALRNAYRGTGFIDGGRITITRWLFKSLYDNKPYDQFVRELISPPAGSGAEGFTKGIVWRGVVNASQVPPVQAAQNLGQVFLGTNLKCASCHDSFVNSWKLTDAYSLASVFADRPLEIHRCDQPTGKTSSVGFVYPELGKINASGSRAERMEQLAGLFVKRENGRFARTMVNRLWAHMMGRGLIEPLDDLDQPSAYSDLLDWLADEFAAKGYDVKYVLNLIATSRAYSMRGVGTPDPHEAANDAYVFKGPYTKRVSAEQFVDGLSALTGVWPKASGDMITVDGRGQGGQVAAIQATLSANRKPLPQTSSAQAAEAKWIWNSTDALHDKGGRVLFRKVINLDSIPKRAIVAGTCDNELVIYVNGKKVAEGTEWTRPVSAEITPHLKRGANVIAVEATNWPDVENNKGTQVTNANPAGLLVWAGGFDGSTLKWSAASDQTWQWAKPASRDWKTNPRANSGWKQAELLPPGAIIWGKINLPEAVEQSGVTLDDRPLRAALLFDDPLLSALGRTSREQVVTRRESVATTLQALELTNGTTLDSKLREGAKRRFEAQGKDIDAMVSSIFLDALGRPISSAELSASRELVGNPASVESVHDLLWTVVMLPEFQLIP